MNDYIVLLDKNQQKVKLARFVDTTAAKEVRPVVDIFFAKQAEALTFGRSTILRSTSQRKTHRFRKSENGLVALSTDVMLAEEHLTIRASAAPPNRKTEGERCRS